MLRLRRVREIEGVTVSSRDGRWIIERLREIGRADDVTAAASIEHGLANNIPVDWLAEGEKISVMMALVDCPYGLAELRGTLAREIRDRQA